MKLALSWLRTQLNSTNTLRHWYVDSFPDLETCLRDPNRYIDQKFIDWVVGEREPRDPPDYLTDMHHRRSICNVTSELDVSANRVSSKQIKYTESYITGSNKAEDFPIDGNADQRNNFLDDINNNLDENRGKIKTIGEVERVDRKKTQRRSRRTRNLKRKNSINQPKHRPKCLGVPRNDNSSNSPKLCMPLREIQDAPTRMRFEESSRLFRGKSETKMSSKFTFNVSVFRCVVNGCGKLYRRRSHLQSHVRRHTGERPFPCTWQGCRWKFSRSDELVRHMRSHSGDKPFNCTTCSKRFARSDHLKKHLRVHQKALIG